MKITVVDELQNNVVNSVVDGKSTQKNGTAKAITSQYYASE